MADDLSKYYWDACIFYEHLRGETTTPARKVAVEQLLVENKKKKNRIFTSVVTHIEVLPKKLGPDKEKAYWSTFGSMHFFDAEIDRNIVMLAREIKDFYSDAKDNRMMSTGDALHLATAIKFQATEFHTRDKRPKHGNVALLGLASNSPGRKICGKYELEICDPQKPDLLNPT